MKTSTLLLFATFALNAPQALGHPDHDDPPGIKGMRLALPPPVEKAYGRPGDSGQVTRTINLVINDKMRLTPGEITVKQGETIKFVVKNSTGTPQRLALGTASELKERVAMLKQFPKMEMNQPNLVQVKPGESAELVWQFTQAGEFNFGCTAPACLEAGKIGKIVVSAN